MERRGSFSDESALTKSAAWAWLERRSASEGRSKPEFNVSRKKSDLAAAPSRYKAEAMRKKDEESSNTNLEVSLLDKYDIERISRQLDYYIELSRSSRRGRAAAAAAETKSKNGGGGKKVGKGMWLGSHAPLACGSARGEVVEMKSMEYMRRRRRSSSEKGRAAAAAVEVEVVGCRPRQGIRA